MQLSWTRTAGLTMVCLCLMWMAGTIYAGVEDFVADDVKFYITDDAAYTYHTTDQPNDEIATVSFKVAFDLAQGGYLQGADIKFTYDPNRVTLIAVRPVAGWGSVTPILDTTRGSLMTVFYGIDPAPGASTIPISQAQTVLAEFDFRVECQTAPASTELAIVTAGTGTRVDDGTYWHYVTAGSGDFFPGHVGVYAPHWAAWLGDTFGQMELPGALGKVIDVPIFVSGPFRLAYADMKFSYDVTKLQFVGLSALDATITADSISFPTSGQVRTRFYTDEAIVPRRQFTSDVIANLQFRVLGSWQGGSTEVGWVQNPGFTVAQDAGTCGIPFSNGIAVGCTISIPAYEAVLTTEFTDGGTLSLTDNQVSMMIKMTNNFPAGKGWKKIIVNACLGDDLYTTGQLTYEAVNLGAFPYYAGNVQELSIFSEANSNLVDTSASPRELVSFNMQTVSGFLPPTDFDNRFYPITYQTPFDSDTSYSARVIDTTGRAVLTNPVGNLTWDTPQIEYLMGEYYCPGVESGGGLIAQSYYIRNSFAVHDFRVKISVSGAHSMYDIALEPGVEVEELDSTSFKWIIIKSGEDWVDQAATETRVKFATITYAYWTQSHMLELSQPGPGGYWVTKTSEVLFVFDQPSGFFMKDPAGVDQHEVELSGGLVSRWYVYPPDPERDLAGPGGLPTEYALLQNYPNPFNPTTAFWYALPEGAWVEVSVYNITGQKVATLSDGWREAGFYNATWDGSDVASGVYFYRIVTDKFTESKKMILLK